MIVFERSVHKCTWVMLQDKAVAAEVAETAQGICLCTLTNSAWFSELHLWPKPSVRIKSFILWEKAARETEQDH